MVMKQAVRKSPAPPPRPRRLGIAEDTAGARFLDRVEVLKQHHEGGVEDFAPEPMKIQPVDPFARRAGARR